MIEDNEIGKNMLVCKFCNQEIYPDDTILHLISRYIPFSYTRVIIECLKEFCLKGHVNLRGYND